MSKSEVRVRNQVSDLSVHVPPGEGPWMKSIDGGFSGFPGLPGLPQTALEAFNAQLASHPNAAFPAVDVEVIQTMRDVITPGFHEIVEKGEFRPINPMSKTVHLKQPVAVTDVSFKQLGVQSPRSYAVGSALSQRYVAEVPAPGAMADETDINAMLLEAKASLKSAGMDYLTTAAEFRETLGMFLNMKQNLLNRRDGAVKAWSKDLAQKRRSGKFRGFNSLKEGWEAFSNFWLEYRFGWRILAYDIEAILDYYKRKDEGVVLFTRRNTRTFEDSSSYLYGKPTEYTTCFFEMWAYLEATERVRVGYSAHIDQSVLGNPILLNTAYDITPWTLVVDMFFNVQNNIIALSTMPVGCSEVPDSGFISREQTVSLTLLPKIVNKVGLQLDERIISVQTTGINRRYDRGKIGEPSFDISYQPNLDLGKIIDLATLALPIFRIIRNFLK